MSFGVGDPVIYPQHGPGRVVEVTKRKVGDLEREYLVVEAELADLRLWVPVDETADLGVRPPVPKDEVEDVIAVLREHDVKIPNNFSRRFKNHQNQLNTGDIYDLASVVRNLAVRKDRKHLSASEKRQYEHARALLSGELAMSLKVDSDAALAKIDEALPGDPSTFGGADEEE